MRGDVANMWHAADAAGKLALLQRARDTDCLLDIELLDCDVLDLDPLAHQAGLVPAYVATVDGSGLSSPTPGVVCPALASQYRSRAWRVRHPPSEHRYRAELLTRAEVEELRSREGYTDVWGWWVDICPGATLTLRDATPADIERCALREDSSRNPADWFCEASAKGSLVSKRAVAKLHLLPARPTK